MTERILATICLVSLFMKFLHLPGSGILLTLSTMSLAVYYAFYGYTVFHKLKFKDLFSNEAKEQFTATEVFISKGSGMVMSIALVSILFKFQQWPGGKIMMVVGMVGCIALAVYSFIRKSKEEGSLYRNLMIRGVVLGAFCLILFSIPHSIWLNWRHPDNPDYIEAELEYMADPENEELREKRNEELDKMYNE